MLVLLLDLPPELVHVAIERSHNVLAVMPGDIVEDYEATLTHEGAVIFKVPSDSFIRVIPVNDE